VLALAKDADAPRADLGAAILGAYSPGSGWGDGRANLVCMQAVLELFREPIPDGVAISLEMDDKVIAQGKLDRDRIRDLMVLSASGVRSAGSHRFRIAAEPAVAGLGFSLAVTSWVPWPQVPSDGGIALVITPPERAKVGAALPLTLQAQAPAGEPLAIQLALPAGVQVDERSLEALVGAGKLTAYDVTDDRVTLTCAPLQPAQMFSAEVRVIPTLAGNLHSGPASLRVAGVTLDLPPAAWAIE
jgi:hypothetical protein